MGFGGGVGLGTGGTNCERFRLILVVLLLGGGGVNCSVSKERKKSPMMSRCRRNESMNPVTVRLFLTF
jgi:hypothetical protein